MGGRCRERKLARDAGLTRIVLMRHSPHGRFRQAFPRAVRSIPVQRSRRSRRLRRAGRQVRVRTRRCDQAGSPLASHLMPLPADTTKLHHYGTSRPPSAVNLRSQIALPAPAGANRARCPLLCKHIHVSILTIEDAPSQCREPASAPSLALGVSWTWSPNYARSKVRVRPETGQGDFSALQGERDRVSSVLGLELYQAVAHVRLDRRP